MTKLKTARRAQRAIEMHTARPHTCEFRASRPLAWLCVSFLGSQMSLHFLTSSETQSSVKWDTSHVAPKSPTMMPICVGHCAVDLLFGGRRNTTAAAPADAPAQTTTARSTFCAVSRSADLRARPPGCGHTTDAVVIACCTTSSPPATMTYERRTVRAAQMTGCRRASVAASAGPAASCRTNGGGASPARRFHEPPARRLSANGRRDL